ncbi:MAG: class I SAM-dependent methyltransferase [Chloroflexi bacterium]|nr:class I SAM-dependent methyltransferase [Chloroflexota bacterium]
MLRKLFFDFQYRFARPPWDTGITPPEVVAFVANNSTHGRALDLGCGTGTNSIYLASQGYQVVGVDFSSKAIASARFKAKREQLAIDFHVADVTHLEFLNEPFDYVLDIGCLHAIDETGRTRYAEHIARLTQSGSVFMLYAFSPRPANEPRHLIQFRNVGITPDQVEKLFASDFKLERIEHGGDRDERKSAWYWFVRQSNSRPVR